MIQEDQVITPLKYFDGNVVTTLQQFILGNMAGRSVAYQLDGHLIYSAEAVRRIILAYKKDIKSDEL